MLKNPEGSGVLVVLFTNAVMHKDSNLNPVV